LFLEEVEVELGHRALLLQELVVQEGGERLVRPELGVEYMNDLLQ
jgi:hypothetical protein